MSDPTRDQKSDATSKQSAMPATSPDERVKDLHPEVSEEDAGKVSGGRAWSGPGDEGPEE